MSQNQLKKIKELESLIARTPLLKIAYRYQGELRHLYAKAEYFNISGSIKDRMAHYILKKGYEEGTLKEGAHIVEATSGNTGIAFSALGRCLGHQVTIYMPNWMSSERINLIQSFGANIRLVTPEEGGFIGSIAMTKELAQKDKSVFLPEQFDNPYNCDAHYHTTGPEIWCQMAQYGAIPEAFVAGVGTGGTIMGVGRYLKEKNPNIKAHPMEPENSPTLRTGHRVGKHRIQGISDEFIPAIVQLDQLDEIVSVDDGDGIVMAQKLARNLGIGVGISSGANFIAAVMLQNKNPKLNVVTVFSDDSKKYLSTDYVKEEPLKDSFLSTAIELVGVESIRSLV